MMGVCTGFFKRVAAIFICHLKINAPEYICVVKLSCAHVRMTAWPSAGIAGWLRGKHPYRVQENDDGFNQVGTDS